MSPVMSSKCPHLDSIQRPLLDFDFPPHCSVTLDSSPHVYACLTCGKFFRGRGQRTPAYTHSVDSMGHCVFLHLTTGRYFCLPDNYEIPLSEEPSLQDISRALRPVFGPQQVLSLDANRELARDLMGRRYLPGFVGLNNLNRTDYLNSVVQALGHVRPLRDFFLLAGSSTSPSQQQPHNIHMLIPYEEFSPLAKSFSLLLRNMWSPHRFKSNIDPHMFVQAVSVASNKRYHVGRQADAAEFLAWLLHQLHCGVGGKNKKRKRNKTHGRSSVIHETFGGEVEVTTVVKRRRRRGEEAALQMFQQQRNLKLVPEKEDDDRGGSDDEESIQQKQRHREALQVLADEIILVEEETVTETEFLQLTLDIPEKPLFKDDEGGLVIPQEPLVNVLRKFDGVSFFDVIAMQQQHKLAAEEVGASGDGPTGIIVSKKRRYRLKTLPRYLILHLSRFKQNSFSVEKNPTIVMFPVKNFDLSSYVFTESGRDKVPKTEDIKNMSTKELIQLVKKYGRADLADASVEREKLIQNCTDFLSTSFPDLLGHKYDLVANITHDIPVEVGREGTQHNPLEAGSYRCHVQHKATGEWYEIQDLNVRETIPQLIGVSESYLLIFERKGSSIM